MAEISKGQVNLNTVLGAIGTYGAVGGGNLLGGLLGGNAAGCGENAFINRYESRMAARISELETEVKLRDANFYTVSELGKLRDYVDSRFAGVEREISEQRVYNAAANSAIACIQGQVAELLALAPRKIPNTSVCPGWGTVTITPATTTTTAGA